MRYKKQNFSVELIGVRHGEMWSGPRGWQEIHTTVRDDATLQGTVKALLSPDFKDAKLTPDSYIKITLIKPNRRVSRFFDITLFGSIADLVKEM